MRLAFFALSLWCLASAGFAAEGTVTEKQILDFADRTFDQTDRDGNHLLNAAELQVAEKEVDRAVEKLAREALKDPLLVLPNLLPIAVRPRTVLTEQGDVTKTAFATYVLALFKESDLVIRERMKPRVGPPPRHSKTEDELRRERDAAERRARELRERLERERARERAEDARERAEDARERAAREKAAREREKAERERKARADAEKRAHDEKDRRDRKEAQERKKKEEERRKKEEQDRKKKEDERKKHDKKDKKDDKKGKKKK
jgi:hypothetical protein